MKKLFTLIAIAVTTIAAQAQTANAVVFSEDGDKFTLILNGEPKNTSPQVNVKVSGLTSTFYTAKIDFENSAILDITSKNFAVELGSEATYVIKKNKKGEYVMRFHSYAPIGSTASTPTSDSGINPETRRIAAVDDGHSEGVSENVSQTVTTPGGTVNADVVVTETTTTKTTSKPVNGENVNVGMTIGGVSMGINMNVSGMDVEENSNTTVTTTTTTKTSTSGAVKEPVREPLPRKEVVVQEPATPCGMVMSSSSFATAKKSIADKGFDDTRLTIAKQVTTSNCLSVTQIKEIMGVFGFEDTKLEYAKFAYGRCTNPGDYYLINDAFSFTSSIDELNEYIQSK